MAGWPWPLDGVQRWFEDLWNWIGRAAVQAVSVVSTWINNAISGLWATISSAFTSLGGSLSSFFGNLWTTISGAFSDVATWISQGLSGLWRNIVSAWTNFTNWISEAVNSLGSRFLSDISSLKDTVTGGFGSLWTNFTRFMSRFWNDMSASIASLPGSFLTALIGYCSSLLEQLGGKLQTASPARWIYTRPVIGQFNLVAGWIHEGIIGALDWLWQNLRAGTTALAGFLERSVLAPLMGALDWVRDAIFEVLKGLVASIQDFFGGHSPITPEEAAGWTVPLLIIGAGAGFGVSVMGAMGSLKVLGSGVEARAVTDFLQSAFALGDMSRSIIMPILNAAYNQPIQYYYNSVYRPFVVSTGTADQMLFEGHISEPDWRRVYAYHGWKEADIDAWAKTVWNEPNQRTLISLLEDPDIPEEWIRLKLKENGFIGEDADQLIAYGRRRVTSDERKALATQVEKDFVEGVINESEMAGDLSALRFTDPEIEYRVAKAQMLKARNERRFEIQAKKPEALRAKRMSESDLEKELSLGLRTPEQFVTDMQDIGFSEDLARRKRALLLTPKALDPREKERRTAILEDRISKARRRYDLQIARQDIQAGFYVDMIEYLSGLPTPPATRIATLRLELDRLADEKALVLRARDEEISDLEAELNLIRVG